MYKRIFIWKKEPKNKEIVRKPADRRWGKGILFQLKAKFHILIKEILKIVFPKQSFCSIIKLEGKVKCDENRKIN